jgi:hypothetical protein
MEVPPVRMSGKAKALGLSERSANPHEQPAIDHREVHTPVGAVLLEQNDEHSSAPDT